jgi:hypothetical protein
MRCVAIQFKHNAKLSVFESQTISVETKLSKGAQKAHLYYFDSVNILGTNVGVMFPFAAEYGNIATMHLDPMFRKDTM